MALNIIDLIKGQLGPSLISQASTQYGESESGISKAISALLPAVVGGMANNANRPEVIDGIRGASSNDLLGNLLGSTTGNTTITNILSAIFGDKITGVVNSVSTYSGVNNTTSSSLLNMVVAAAVGTISKYAAENNLGENGITNLLEDQKGIVSSLLPAGLSLASLGIGDAYNPTGAEKVTTTTYDEPKVEVNRAGETHVTTEPIRTDDGGSIWKWLLPLLLLLLAGWFLWKQCDKPTDETITTTTDSTYVDSDTAMINTTMTDSSMVGTTGTMSDIDLNGKKLRGYENGMEASMITFLKSDSYKNAADDAALKDKWYSFDNVNFKMGSATELEPGSEGQIQNLAEILKAYPDAKIKIGGYTDNTGDAAANKKLSQQRADFIKSELTRLGVGAQITGAEGYGSEFATVAADASDAERAVDRKMAVRFTK
ncbi:flagellar motor protein MotB [Kaistella solincola]|uniref:Flagellar motor protein MotB n=1 Tax=Kaistella solincola TaxID=510955 RepID=A0ABR4ZRM0_9FLAO|nr:OmpA family protein [Kaistella solincola]KIA83344.1 flagellar motor protein MotB [Kaistella solincola]